MHAKSSTEQLIELMDAVARDLGLEVERGETGSTYRPRQPDVEARYTSGIGVFETPRKPRGFEVNLDVFHEHKTVEVAMELKRRLERVSRERTDARLFPTATCASIVRNWPQARAELVEPYFKERERLKARVALRKD